MDGLESYLGYLETNDISGFINIKCYAFFGCVDICRIIWNRNATYKISWNYSARSNI